MTNSLTKFFLGTALAAGLVVGTASASYAGIGFNTSDLLDGEAVGSYFAGATDANNNAGPNLGVTFGAGAINQVSVQSGGTSPFSNLPAGGPNAIFFSSLGSDVVNFASGARYDVSFLYSSFTGGEVDIWSGLNGTGTELASFIFGPNDDPSTCTDPSVSFCQWTDASIEFAGTAGSIDFTGAGITVVGDLAVPEPATVALFASGFAMLGFYRRQNRA
jgi:hypothetical protein